MNKTRTSNRPMNKSNRDRALQRIERELMQIVKASPRFFKNQNRAALHSSWPKLDDYIVSLWEK